jgi:hypothetical protein
MLHVTVLQGLVTELVVLVVSHASGIVIFSHLHYLSIYSLKNGLPSFSLISLRLQNSSLLSNNLFFLLHTDGIHLAMYNSSHTTGQFGPRSTDFTTTGNTRFDSVLQESSHISFLAANFFCISRGLISSSES